jgi:hypothetical protein
MYINKYVIEIKRTKKEGNIFEAYITNLYRLKVKSLL